MSQMKFQPKCFACSSNLQVVEALGLAMEGGQLTCTSCGERYNYIILDGSLALKRTSVPSGFGGSTEETFLPLSDSAAQSPILFDKSIQGIEDLKTVLQSKLGDWTFDKGPRGDQGDVL